MHFVILLWNKRKLFVQQQRWYNFHCIISSQKIKLLCNYNIFLPRFSVKLLGPYLLLITLVTSMHEKLICDYGSSKSPIIGQHKYTSLKTIRMHSFCFDCSHKIIETLTFSTYFTIKIMKRLYYIFLKVISSPNKFNLPWGQPK